MRESARLSSELQPWNQNESSSFAVIAREGASKHEEVIKSGEQVERKDQSRFTKAAAIAKQNKPPRAKREGSDDVQIDKIEGGKKKLRESETFGSSECFNDWNRNRLLEGGKYTRWQSASSTAEENCLSRRTTEY